jgi:hypothetical protein
MPREIKLVPLKARWALEQAECFGEEKNHFQLPKFKPWTAQPIATQLPYQQHCPRSVDNCMHNYYKTLSTNGLLTNLAKFKKIFKKIYRFK